MYVLSSSLSSSFFPSGRRGACESCAFAAIVGIALSRARLEVGGMALPDGGREERGGGRREGGDRNYYYEGELSRVKKTWHATNDGSPGCPLEGWGFAWPNRYLLSISTYLGDFFPAIARPSCATCNLRLGTSAELRLMALPVCVVVVSALPYPKPLPFPCSPPVSPCSPGSPIGVCRRALS